MNRNKIQKKNILFGVTFKGISIFLNFLIVPILIFFLGETEYGVWVTVFSIVNWVFTFDLEIGQGLRNKLTEALSINDEVKASQIISTADVFITILSLIILILGVVFIYLVNFQDLLNYRGKTSYYLQNFVLLSLFFTVINFILSFYKKLYLAAHKSFVTEKATAILSKFGVTAKSVEIWGSVKPKREFLWFEDMANACVFLMESIDFKNTFHSQEKEIRNTHINIGTGVDISIAEIAEKIQKIVGFNGKLNFDTTKPDGTMCKVTDVSKIHDLGWRHTVELDDGIKKLHNWYISN
jgi:hypothetical protein